MAATHAHALREAILQTQFESKEIVLAKVVEMGYKDQFTSKTPLWRDSDSTHVSPEGTVLWVFLPTAEDDIEIAVDFGEKYVDFC